MFVIDSGGVRKERVAAVQVAAQYARDSLASRDRLRHDADRREPLRCLVGVGAHLLDPPAAQRVP